MNSEFQNIFCQNLRNQCNHCPNPGKIYNTCNCVQHETKIDMSILQQLTKKSYIQSDFGHF